MELTCLHYSTDKNHVCRQSDMDSFEEEIQCSTSKGTGNFKALNSLCTKGTEDNNLHDNTDFHIINNQYDISAGLLTEIDEECKVEIKPEVIGEVGDEPKSPTQ